MRTPRTPERFTDENGAELVRVPLAKDAGFATVDADDYDRLIAQGLPSQWSFNRNAKTGPGYVKAAVSRDNSRVIARAIVGAGSKQQVSYRDRDRLNLRRENLRVTFGGRGRYDVCSQLERAQKIAAWREGGKSVEDAGAPTPYAVAAVPA